ncbi:PREDICTED: cadherin-19 [Miniopterus natalensis]|uniref:cadherin-19 n=1 Tax=Miniopterus natalensis TaxID=291302 RepID=UPI0007A72B64|nr:PREDICTED: cadherin-19 [Miniopterus natalensis]
MNRCLFLPLLLGTTVLWPRITATGDCETGDMPPEGPRGREKRYWAWNTFFVEEELNVTRQPFGWLRSDLHNGSKSLKYSISGDGAGSIFFVNATTGVLYVTQKLDREKQACYFLKAQVIDITTGKPVEPESEFVVRVMDINDNAPTFLHEPYKAAVPEMAPEGTFVFQVTASDADDPSSNNNARLVYSVISGQPYFSIEPTTGVIRTSSKMDRELVDAYWVIVQAKDRIGLPGALSGTTRVLVTLSDVNDNKPTFKKSLYSMNVSESTPAGASIGIITAHDKDIGVNAEMDYSIADDASQTFGIVTDNETQEGIVILKKKVDFEHQNYYRFRAQVRNRHVDKRLLGHHTPASTTLVRVQVADEDEPPAFLQPRYTFQVPEGSPRGAPVGSVSALDPDHRRAPVRYSITSGSAFQIYDNGTIVTAGPLDRETSAWCNLSITAREIGNAEQASEVPVYVQVLNVNDHAPEFPEYYETYVCEKASSGQVVQTISAVDRDDSIEDQHFYFNLSMEDSKNSTFTITDNQDNTAVILTNRTGFSLQEEPVFYITILIADNGTPSLTSTNTLTIRVCDCDDSGSPQICSAKEMLLMESRTDIVIAVLTCAVIILGFIFTLLVLRQRRKQPLFAEKGKDFKERIIRYADEGEGQEDAQALATGEPRGSPVRRARRPRKAPPAGLRGPSWQVGPDDAVIKEFILEKLAEANTDPFAPPFDSLRTYAFEGTGSSAGSLSSLESAASGEGEHFDCLQDLEPPFTRSACVFGSATQSET